MSTSHVVSTDALAFFAGQDLMIRVLLSEQQSAQSPNLDTVRALQAHRRNIRERLSSLAMEALREAGIDTSEVISANLDVDLDDSGVSIRCEVERTGNA